MPFSKEVIATIKATAPILDVHGELLTRHFYKRMFLKNPEVKPYFNEANQHTGKQQRALAGAVVAYAHNIANLGALGSAVELIAQKHAGLQILPEHYPIVGENLLESIKEVLGDAATPDIISAWATAYGALADILIAREKELYDAAAAAPHGWRGFRKFRVAKKLTESTVVTSFILEPVDGKPVPAHEAGQYLTIRVPTADGTSTTMRNYSLSATADGKTFRISVRRDDGDSDAAAKPGYVSTRLHADVNVGDTLDIAPPFGNFNLARGGVCPVTGRGAPQRPLVFLAAGVGITPLLPMLHKAVATTPATTPIVFLHAVRNAGMHPLRAEVDAVAKAHPNVSVRYFYSDADAKATSGVTQGLIDETVLRTLPGSLDVKDCDVYFCGPAPFMGSVGESLKTIGLPAAQMHYEFFGPLEPLKCPMRGAKGAAAV